jgi:desulfoferrodoxin-like iron-binding protein
MLKIHCFTHFRIIRFLLKISTILEHLKVIQRRYFMPNKGEIYKCELCGNVVLVLEAGGGALVCCGEDMQLLSDEEAKAYRSH